MNFNQYNSCCLFTSIIMLTLVIIKFKEIDLCVILLLAACFSIIWRGAKLIFGEDNIEKTILNNRNENENNNETDNETGNKNKIIYTKGELYHPLFLLDFTFAILAFMCVINSKQINHKFIYLVILTFAIAWTLYFLDIRSSSRSIHFVGHCYVILIVIFTFYLYLR